MRKITYEDCRPVINRFIRSLKSNQISSIALFGSIARSEGKLESDIDLILIFKGDRKKIQVEVLTGILALRESKEYKNLEKIGYYPEICPLFLSMNELEGHPWILLDVIDHGIILQDKDHRLESELSKMKKKLIEFGTQKVMLPDGSWYWDLKPSLKLGEVFDT